MVPIEQLSDSNFLNVYFIASEIKRELEVTPDSKKYIDIRKSFAFSQANPNYPCPFNTRFQTIKYLQELGQIISYYDLDRKISLEVVPQEVFFLFCNKLANIYNNRFTKPKGDEEKINALANDQIKKIKQVIDTIFIKAESEKLYDSVVFSGSVTIPYNHFPSAIDPFEVNGIIYNLVNDFKVISLKKQPMWFDKHANPEVIVIEFPSSNYSKFKELKKTVDDKYQTISEDKEKDNRASKSENESSEVKSILLITPQYSNFDFFWIVFNHDYAKKHKVSMVNKQTKRQDGIGNNLWILCAEKKVDFDSSFLNYMNGKIFNVTAFKGFKKTKLVQMKDNKILINAGIVLEKKSKELFDKAILKYFP